MIAISTQRICKTSSIIKHSHKLTNWQLHIWRTAVQLLGLTLHVLLVRSAASSSFWFYSDCYQTLWAEPHAAHDHGDDGVFFFLKESSALCREYPPFQPFPLEEAREVHGLLVGRKRSSAQVITDYSARRGELTWHRGQRPALSSAFQTFQPNMDSMMSNNQSFCKKVQRTGLNHWRSTPIINKVSPVVF